MELNLKQYWDQAPEGVIPPKIYYGYYKSEGKLFLTVEDHRSVFFFVPIAPISSGNIYRESRDPYKEHRLFSCVKSQCKITEYLDVPVYEMGQTKVVSCTKPFNEAHKFVVSKILERE